MKKIHLWFMLIAGIFISLIPALQNGYPLMYFDSDTYVNLAMRLAPNKTNPFGYGIFIWIFSFKWSLWPVIMAQSVIINLLIFEVLKDFFKNHNLVISYLASVVILTLFTGFGWFTSMIMADIFVAVMILALYLFMKQDISRRKMLLMGFIILFAASTHFTIILNLFLLGILFTIIHLVKRKSIVSYKTQLYKSLFLLFPMLVLFLFKSDDFFRKAVNDKGVSHVFIMARLMETGILDDYLKKNCDQKDYALCNYIDQFPDMQSSFVWDKNSPLYQTDGWKDTSNEYREIISDVFTSPYYLSVLTYKSIISGIRQFFNYRIETIPLNQESTIHKTIHKHFHHELKKFRTSLQFRDLLKLEWLNVMQNILLIAGFAVVLFLLLFRKNQLYPLVFTVFTAILFNAFVCAAFSTVVNRYQARAAWLMAFILILYILKNAMPLIHVTKSDD